MSLSAKLSTAFFPTGQAQRGSKSWLSRPTPLIPAPHAIPRARWHCTGRPVDAIRAIRSPAGGDCHEHTISISHTTPLGRRGQRIAGCPVDAIRAVRRLIAAKTTPDRHEHAIAISHTLPTCRSGQGTGRPVDAIVAVGSNARVAHRYEHATRVNQTSQPPPPTEVGNVLAVQWMPSVLYAAAVELFLSATNTPLP